MVSIASVVAQSDELHAGLLPLSPPRTETLQALGGGQEAGHYLSLFFYDFMLFAVCGDHAKASG